MNHPQSTETKPPASIGLIADSCCDVTPEILKATGVSLVPLQVQVEGGGLYNDDGTIDIRALLEDMRRSSGGAKSACPSVEEYAGYMRRFDACFVVTLSSKLSGSFNSARLAARMVMEESPKKRIHVLDSKSASAGETSLLLFLREMVDAGRRFEEIVSLAEARVRNTRTLFVLQDFRNLIKNGRMAKIPGLIATVLAIRPVMGDDGAGQIKLLATTRGIQRAYAQLIEIVKGHTKGAMRQTIPLVLAYCNCLEQAEQLRQRILEQCEAIRKVILVPTGALSTMYASDGGIVVAFPEGT